jgi:hypothetical protein
MDLNTTGNVTIAQALKKKIPPQLFPENHLQSGQLQFSTAGTS